MAFDVAGNAYQRFMGQFSDRLSAPFADFAGVTAGSGMRVVDVGCGTGRVDRGAGRPARRLGGGGGRPVGAVRGGGAVPAPGRRHPAGPGRGAAVRGRRLRRRPGAAGRPLHEGPGGRRRRDGPGDAARRRRGGLRLGPRRRPGTPVALLVGGRRGRPGRLRTKSRSRVRPRGSWRRSSGPAAWRTSPVARSPPHAHTPRSRTGGSPTPWAWDRPATTCARSTTRCASG